MPRNEVRELGQQPLDSHDLGPSTLELGGPMNRVRAAAIAELAQPLALDGPGLLEPPFDAVE